MSYIIANLLRKNPPNLFWKANFIGATEIISFCDKDAIGRNEKNIEWRWTYIVKSEIINQIWNDNIDTYSKKDIEYIINSFIEIVQKEVRKGSKVKIEGLGTFLSYIRQAHVGKNVNGNIEEIPNAKCISFKPSKKLKQ